MIGRHEQALREPASGPAAELTLAMNEADKFALVPRPPGGLEKAEAGAKRVLAGMVADTLALAPQAKAGAPSVGFRLGAYAWREPDYRQILMWAEQTGKRPEAIIQRLVEMKSSFADGRLLEVKWDEGSMLIRRMRFVTGLGIRVFHLCGGGRTIGIVSTFKNSPPGVTPMDCEVSEIHLQGLSELEVLAVSQQNLRELDLSGTPKIKKLYCESNVLTRLNLQGCKDLEEILARNNQLAELDLSNLPALQVLECGQNELRHLDLSGVPALEVLDCGENTAGVYGWDRIEVLDITPLHHLKKLKFDKGKTRLIQRPDQHF